MRGTLGVIQNEVIMNDVDGGFGDVWLVLINQRFIWV